MRNFFFLFILSCGGGGGGGSSTFSFDESSAPSVWASNVFPIKFAFSEGFEEEFGDVTFIVSIIEGAWKTKVPAINPIISYDNTPKVHPNSNSKSDYYSTPSQTIGIYPINNTQLNAMGIPGSALAVTIYTVSSTTGNMTKAAILLNNGSGYLFSSLEELPSLNHYDLSTIFAHEMGHVLGLSHVGSALDEANINIMKPALGSGEKRRVSQTEEINALRDLYPSSLSFREEEDQGEDIEGWIALMPNGICLHSHK